MNKRLICLSVFFITIIFLPSCAIFTKESNKMPENDSQQSVKRPVIVLADLVLAVNEQIPDSLKEIFSEENLLSPTKSIITLEQFKNLSKEQQIDLADIIKRAVVFYRETAYVKPMEPKRVKIAEQLQDFIELAGK